MNKRAYIFYLSVFIVGFVIAFFCGMKAVLEDSYNVVNTEQTNQSNNSKKEDGYWVKAISGTIFVYKSDTETLVAETDIKISNLTDKEKRILEDGIYLENSEELFKYLEANTSWRKMRIVLWKQL